MSTKIQIRAKVPSTSMPSFTSLPTALLQRKCACGSTPGVDGECAECRRKRLALQHHAINQAEISMVPSIMREMLRSPGQPLDAATRAFMEPRFGYDFSQVRVHTDARAAESVRAVNALAYTVGRNVVFAAGQYTPTTMEGRRLLAHELTHVVQQGNYAAADVGGISQQSGVHEQEAAQVGKSIADGGFKALKSSSITPFIAPLIQRDTPRSPSPLQPPQTCGPDATDWFIQQVAKAKTDRAVLAIQADLAGARRVAASHGFSVERVAEGGVAKRVFAEEARVGSPPHTPEAASQIAASVPGQRQFGRALVAATVPVFGAAEALVLAAIRRASLGWKALVGTNKRYDFKNDSRTMKSPRSSHCPVSCANTITLCPSSGSDCFRTDVPGNLFYAHVGRFIGFTELALQLGSQFAQLESTRSWDPPEDTRMISIGFALPDPLTRAALCASIAANRSSFTLLPCNNCPKPTAAVPV